MLQFFQQNQFDTGLVADRNSILFSLFTIFIVRQP